MNPDPSILKVESLRAGYGDNIILQDVSFELQKGEALIIIGQNGSGKSTLLKSLCGLIPKKGGKLFFHDRYLSSILPHQLIKFGISYFVQDGLIMPALTIEEHLAIAARNNGNNKETFEEVFTHFPKLYTLKNKRAGNLSGGERQMLSFGILIMQNTTTWFLDEPTAGLAPSIVEFTAEFLQIKNKNDKITMLIVEHNMNVVFEVASHIAVTKNKTLTLKFSQQEFLTKDFLNKIVYN